MTVTIYRPLVLDKAYWTLFREMNYYAHCVFIISRPIFSKYSMCSYHLDQYHLLYYLYDVIPKFRDGHFDSIFCL